METMTTTTTGWWFVATQHGIVHRTVSSSIHHPVDVVFEGIVLVVSSLCFVFSVVVVSSTCVYVCCVSNDGHRSVVVLVVEILATVERVDSSGTQTCQRNPDVIGCSSKVSYCNSMASQFS